MDSSSNAVGVNIPPFLKTIMDKALDSADLTDEIDRIQVKFNPVREYIHDTWEELTRTQEHWFLGALEDPKMPVPEGKPKILYISEKEDKNRVIEEVKQARAAVVRKIQDGEISDLTEDSLPEVEVRVLPKPPLFSDEEHGLLYLPKPYIVPGPRFNEMYNWDSAFVVRGLLQDEKYDLAKSLVDNMLYQVEHYGTILNGNRTYYLDEKKSRSQPPLLTAKVLGVYDMYEKLKEPQKEGKDEWLARAASLAEEYHKHWVSGPHLHDKSGLSMYNTEHDTAGAEVIKSEPIHYHEAFEQLVEMHHRLQQEGEETYQRRKDRYYVEQFLEVDDQGNPLGLSGTFYRGDWAMRESGYDPSRRFGFFNADIINHLPICLNSLRVKMEHEMGLIHTLLGNDHQANQWFDASQKTGKAVNEWLWDAEAEHPSFRDRNINTALCAKHNIPAFRDYDFAAAFFPLWTGIATQGQAKAVVEHLLPQLLCEHGLLTSTRQTGSQWDSPFMWAPMQVAAVEGLERYGYYDEALDLAKRFQTTLINDFERTGKLYEKYNGELGSSEMGDVVKMGYNVNVPGFAWTNSVALELSVAMDRLQRRAKGEVISAEEFPPNLLNQDNVDTLRTSDEPETRWRAGSGGRRL